MVEVLKQRFYLPFGMVYDSGFWNSIFKFSCRFTNGKNLFSKRESRIMVLKCHEIPSNPNTHLTKHEGILLATDHLGKTYLTSIGFHRTILTPDSNDSLKIRERERGSHVISRSKACIYPYEMEKAHHASLVRHHPSHMDDQGWIPSHTSWCQGLVCVSRCVMREYLVEQK